VLLFDSKPFETLEYQQQQTFDWQVLQGRVLYLAPDGGGRAAHNRCRHQGGRFQAELGCSVRCPWHGWVLDVARMTYMNPTGDAPQPELEVERQGALLTLWETPPAAPWQAGARPRAPLAAGELAVTYLAHACVSIEAGGYVLCTDPWLEGPAFTRGWWLAHEPPPGALERVARADLVYSRSLDVELLARGDRVSRVLGRAAEARGGSRLDCQGPSQRAAPSERRRAALRAARLSGVCQFLHGGAPGGRRDPAREREDQRRGGL
jgi:nitrite reductase/ring-hydroxylating ferredoxin subunit